MKKIMTEPYNPIPPQFSDNMKQLIAEMLIKDPNARPSIRDILQKKFLAVFYSHNMRNLLHFPIRNE